MMLPDFLTLPFWNKLAASHLPELIMVLTAALCVLLDRYVRKLVNNFTGNKSRVMRFFIFLVVCSLGYAALALGVAWVVRSGLTLQQGAYMAPTALGILVIVAIEAQRQRQV